MAQATAQNPESAEVDRSNARFAFGLVALTAFLLVFGSTVRVHGAGLACPDWPLCFGQVVPAFEFKVYLEFGHRVVAGFVSLGFLWQAWRLKQGGYFGRSAVLGALYVAAALTLAVQVVLGGLTVWELLAEWTVASHLITGNTFAVLLLLIAKAVRDQEATLGRGAVHGAQRALAVVLILLVPTQIVLGGLVAGSHAGLACATWPGCNGPVWFPTFEGLMGLQVIHRVVAYGLALAVLVNLGVQRTSPTLRRPAALLVVLVALQIAIGVSNVLLRLPAEVTLLHSAGAAAIYLTAAWQLYEAFAAPATASQPSSALPVSVDAT